MCDVWIRLQAERMPNPWPNIGKTTGVELATVCEPQGFHRWDHLKSFPVDFQHRTPTQETHSTRKNGWRFLTFPVDVPYLSTSEMCQLPQPKRFENASTMLVTSNILGTTIAWLGCELPDLQGLILFIFGTEGTGYDEILIPCWIRHLHVNCWGMLKLSFQNIRVFYFWRKIIWRVPQCSTCTSGITAVFGSSNSASANAPPVSSSILQSHWIVMLHRSTGRNDPILSPYIFSYCPHIIPMYPHIVSIFPLCFSYVSHVDTIGNWQPEGCLGLFLRGLGLHDGVTQLQNVDRVM